METSLNIWTQKKNLNELNPNNKRVKQSRCLPTEEWVNSVLNIKVLCSSRTDKKNDTCYNLDNIMLKEKKTQAKTYNHMIPFHLYKIFKTGQMWIDK